MIFDDFFPLCLVASHTRSKGDTGIRNEEWWEMLKKVSTVFIRISAQPRISAHLE